MSKKLVLTKEILQHRLIAIEDFGSMTPEAAELYASEGELAKISEVPYGEDASGKDLAWLQQLNVEVAEKLPPNLYCLKLDQLKELSVDTAKALAKNKCNNLTLNGITSLSEELADALSNYWGKLELNGITSLDKKTADALSSFAGQSIHLGSVDEISEDALVSLAGVDADLDLCSLKSLSDKAAKALVAKKRLLDLSGLAEISEVVAGILSQNKNNILSEKIEAAVKAAGKKASKEKKLTTKELANIRKMLDEGSLEKVTFALDLLDSLGAEDKDYAKLFGKGRIKKLIIYNGVMFNLLFERLSNFDQALTNLEEGLNGLRWGCREGDEGGDLISSLPGELSDSLIEFLSTRHRQRIGSLDLNNLESLSDSAAKSLTKFKGSIIKLNGLKEITDSAASSLAHFKGDYLSLRGLRKLSDAAAGSLSLFTGELDLSGLTELSDAAAESLSKHKGREHYDSLDLRGLADLSDQAAESLSKHKGYYLSLDGIKKLSDAAAQSFAKHKGWIGLGLSELNDSKGHLALAAKLVAPRGELSSFVKISDAALEVFSSYEIKLELNGLTELSDAAAESLSKHKGDLELNGLTELSDAAAESLSRHKGDLYLNGLTELSDAVAECFSKFQDSLQLGGLTEIKDTSAHLALANLLKSKSYSADHIELPSVQKISDAALEALSTSEFSLCLNGLGELSDTAAEILSQYSGNYLKLEGLTSLSKKAAQSLAKISSGVYLPDNLDEIVGKYR